MGAGFWWISAHATELVRVDFASAPPFVREIADLGRVYGDANVCVRPHEGCADVRRCCPAPDAPTEALDTCLSTFTAFMRRFEAASVAFPAFAWTVRAGVRGYASHQILCAADVRRTLTCWDDVVRVLVSAEEAEAEAKKAEAKARAQAQTQTDDDDYELAADDLDADDLAYMLRHLERAKSVFQAAAQHGWAVQIQVAFD